MFLLSWALLEGQNAAAQFVPSSLVGSRADYVVVFEDHVSPAFRKYPGWGDTQVIWMSALEKGNTAGVNTDALRTLLRGNDKNLAALVVHKNQIVERVGVPSSPEEVQALAKNYRDGLLFSSERYNLALGKAVNEGYNAYTGLLVFYRAGCPNCQAEKASLQALCKSKTLQITVILTKDEGEVEGCTNKLDTRLANRWGIQYVPALVFLKQGRLGWLDVGFRGDLPQVASALAVLEKEMQ